MPIEDALTWAGIALCVTHSGIFSGLNLAMFSLGRLSLEIASENGDEAARRILRVRADANFMLTTILWGNVAVNTLLTLLSDSVLTGLGAFLFSTIGITVFGEIIPQAYFSRYALAVGSKLVPVLRFYQWVLYPVAKPTALLLDQLLGPEAITYFRENDLKAVIEKHMRAEEADLEKREGVGLLNYLQVDDLPIGGEGELLDPSSIIRLPVQLDLPIVPDTGGDADHPFVKEVLASGRKWIVLTDEDDQPRVVMDADAFVRDIVGKGSDANPYHSCHRPIVVDDAKVPLGKILSRFEVDAEHDEDDVVDRDIVLLWSDEKRIITGADVLGRLLRGIVRRRSPAPPETSAPGP